MLTRTTKVCFLVTAGNRGTHRGNRLAVIYLDSRRATEKDQLPFDRGYQHKTTNDWGLLDLLPGKIGDIAFPDRMYQVEKTLVFVPPSKDK